MIPRFLKESLQDKIKSNCLLLVRGPGYVGKVTLIKEVLKAQNLNFSVFNCTNKKNSWEKFKEELKDDVEAIVFTEAQYLKELQLIVESRLNGEIKQSIIVSCSHTPQIDADLRTTLSQEGLDFILYAPTFSESAQHFGLPKEIELLEERLIFGNYPSVLANLENREETLKEIILEVIHTNLGVKGRINKEDKLMYLLQQISYGIGTPMSYFELGELAGLNNETVERYIELLIEAHVLIDIPSYHNGNRYELKKSHCFYFLDNGIRNALIGNFNSIYGRNDMEELWRNYLIAERVKWIRMKGIDKEIFFWRTTTGQQIDFIEKGEVTIAFKTDWKKKNKVKIPKLFTSFYPAIKTSLLNRSTYLNFLTKKV